LVVKKIDAPPVEDDREMDCAEGKVPALGEKVGADAAGGAVPVPPINVPGGTNAPPPIITWAPPGRQNKKIMIILIKEPSQK
jgi:hypothetical protein